MDVVHIRAVILHRLKVEGHQRFSCFGLQPKDLSNQLSLANRLGFLSDQDASLIEPKIVETEKVLNSLDRSRLNNLQPSVY